MKPQILIRHSPPNQYDQAVYGTKCKVVGYQVVDWYVQKSLDEDNPKWEHEITEHEVSKNE